MNKAVLIRIGNEFMEERNIWVMWWQGEDSAPPLIKACIKSIRKNANGASVVIIDKNNYSDYVTLPEHVVEKLKQGLMGFTNFSDVLRLYLLYQQGGLWIDSTMYVSRPIPQEIFDRDFYSLKRTQGSVNNIAHLRWSTYLLAGKKGSVVYKYGSQIYSNYWKQNDFLFEFLLLDFIIDYLYSAETDIKEMIDAVPFYKENVYEIQKNIAEHDGSELDGVTGLFNKLSYKQNWKTRTEDGALTVYGRILDEAGELTDAPNVSSRIGGTKKDSTFTKLLNTFKLDKRIGFYKALSAVCRKVSFKKNRELTWLMRAYNNSVCEWLRKHAVYSKNSDL